MYKFGSIMMQTFVLMIFAASDVYCKLTPSFTQKGVIRSFFDESKHIIGTTLQNSPNGCNCSKLQRGKAADCSDLLDMGYNKSGVYQIWPISTPTLRIMEGKSFYVYCDMETNGGGWTVIQRRGDFKRSKDYFYRNWENYKHGFGKINEDFWLGNEKIFALTNQKLYAVRFDLQDINKAKRYAEYDEFWIDDEKRNYALHIDLYSGDAGDAMKYHNNDRFYTFDHDHSEKLAARYKGGGWYHCCAHHANLNGLYYKGKHGNTNDDGISWYEWKGDHESLEWTEIKIRPKRFRSIFALEQHSIHGFNVVV